jgi:hypothetical protein
MPHKLYSVISKSQIKLVQFGEKKTKSVNPRYLPRWKKVQIGKPTPMVNPVAALTALTDHVTIEAADTSSSTLATHKITMAIVGDTGMSWRIQ